MRFFLRSLSLLVTSFVISLICVLQTSHADVWMADEQSLHKLDLAANRIALSLPASKIKQLAVDERDGSVWVFVIGLYKLREGLGNTYETCNRACSE